MSKTLIQKKTVSRNALAAIIQIIFNGVVLFFLYRYLLNTIGIERVGVWSIVMAVTSTARTDFGFVGSVTKFVAQYLARGDIQQAANIVQTAGISIAVFLSIILVIVYQLFSWVLTLVIPRAMLTDAYGVLPYALLSWWLMAIASIFQSGLDGCQRVDLRSLGMMIGSVIYLLTIMSLVPRWGLLGLAWSQLIQWAAIVVMSWGLLRYVMTPLPVFPYRWRLALFREMLGYGLRLQAISFLNLLFDPVIKAYLGKFGGVSIAGYYEMASRLMLQLQALLISANRVLVPVFAELQEKKPENIGKVYAFNVRVIWYLALPLFLGIIICTPLISEVWIGRYEPTFVWIMVVLSVTLFFGMLNVPAYFVYLGTGDLRGSTWGHIIIGMANLVLGFTFGLIFGGKGVVVAGMIALLLGNFTILFYYHRDYHVPYHLLTPRENLFFTIILIIGAITSSTPYYFLTDMLPVYLRAMFSMIIFMIFLLPAIWIHPMKNVLIAWFRKN